MDYVKGKRTCDGGHTGGSLGRHDGYIIKRTCDGGHNTGGGVHGEGSLRRHDRVGDGVGCVGVSATDGGHLYSKRARMTESVRI